MAIDSGQNWNQLPFYLNSLTLDWLDRVTYDQACRQHDFLIAIRRAFGNFEQQLGALIAEDVEILLHCAQSDLGEFGAFKIVKAH